MLPWLISHQMCPLCSFEPVLVEEVVRRVLCLLNRQPLAMPTRLVGMGERLSAALMQVEQHQTATEVKVTMSTGTLYSLS